MAEQLLFSTAERIIESLGSLAAKEIRLLWGIQDELQSLMNTVYPNQTSLPIILEWVVRLRLLERG
jgi:hypothetical protein